MPLRRLFTAFDDLLNLVSICTLFTFFLIACGIIWRHYYAPGINKPWVAAGALFWIIGTSLALAIYYQLNTSGYVGLVVPGALWFAGTCVLTFVPQAYKPKGFSVPLMPWIPSGSIILNVFLLSTIASPESQGGPGSLPYKQWGVFMACCVAVYFLYSLPNITTASRIAAQNGANGATATEMTDLEGKGVAPGDHYSPAIAAV